MPRPRWTKTTKRIVKGAVAIVVLLAVGRHVRNTWNDLHAKGATLHLEPAWVLTSGALYLLGLALCGVFYGSVLHSSPSPIPMYAAIRAYLISHLGKYVPGKAMVVVMRVALSMPWGAKGATASFATFYETLVMMASGSALAAVGFALGPPPIQLVAVACGAGLAGAFLFVVHPRLFPRIARLAATPFPGAGAEVLPNHTGRLLAIGLALTALGWVFLGLSQVAIVRAIDPRGVSLGLWPLVVAGVALATVAGFVVAVLPGGLGVREWVIMTTLAPAIGGDTAVISALALRLTWVAAEAVAALVLVAWSPSRMVSSLGTPNTAPTPASAPTKATATASLETTGGSPLP